ncbi:SGNH/GDSL hydrolase family protein [Mycoplasma zalophidermidis]|uniref:SGNH/GDSL hydrolase family protein n=1 Tax=Mycoplasma zalophidermidis TaxID=398174 RepID=UPI00215BC294|nr:SGNH/GDSL hydrolase family protein [Mycoplasma zalophidermidis]MCR8966629.1 SGNH/GDSL hydrolase family protein [Mycoplasma zalophidermidis]
MKVRIKKTIIILSSALIGTVALATGLSLIPTKDKQVKKSSEINKKNAADTITNIPDLPKKQKTEIINPNVDISSIKLSNRIFSKNAIEADQSINYLAMGDSITAGFVATLDKDYSGKFENGEVSGISYPAYLANFFNKIKRLNAFSNQAVTGSTFADWNLLLKSEGDESKLNEIELKLVKFRFGDGWKNKYQSLVNDLSKSNLITVSLGANDFLHAIGESASNLPLNEIVKLINSKQVNYSYISSLVNDLFNNLFNNIQKRQEEFIDRIQKFAPNSNINFIGFPTPLNTIMNLVDRHINKYDKDAKFNLSTILLDLINKKLKYTATKKNTYFINPFNHDYWVKNAEILTPSLFDIHPGEKGYKKIAIDLFIKLISTNRNAKEFYKHNINFGSTYLNSDQDSFLTQIKLDKDPYQVINEVFGDDLDKFLLTEDKQYLTLKNENKFNEQNYFNRVLDNVGLDEIVFDKVLPNFFESDFYHKIDPQNTLKNFLKRDNNKNLSSLKHWFKDSKIIPNLLKNAEETFKNYDWDNDGKPGAKDNKITYLIEAFKKELSNEPKIINLIFTLTQTTVFKDNLIEFKNIVKNIFTNVVNLDITKKEIYKGIDLIYDKESSKIAPYISKNDLKNLANLILNSETLKTNVADILGNIIEDSPNFSKAKSFKELWFTFIKNPKNSDSIQNIFHHITSDLIKKPEFKLMLRNLVQNLTINYPEYFKNVDINNLADLTNEILEFWTSIDSELGISKDITTELINELKSDLPNNFNIGRFGKNVIERLKSKFDKDNLELNILKLIKNASKINLPKYKLSLQALTKNVIKISTKNKEQTTKFFASIYQTLGTDIQKIINEDDFSSLINKLLNEPKFEDLIDSIIEDVTQINSDKLAAATSLFDLPKIIFENIENSRTLDNLLQLISNSISYPELNSVFSELQKKLPKDYQSINTDTIRSIIKHTITYHELKPLIVSFIKHGLLNTKTTKVDLSTPTTLVKYWLENDGEKQAVKLNLKSFVISLSKNTDLIEIISNIIYIELNKHQPLGENIQLQQVTQLMTALFRDIEPWNDKIKLIDYIVEDLVDNLEINGINLDINNLTNSIVKRIFDKTQPEESTLKLIKIFTESNIIGQNRDVIKQLVTNGLNFASKNMDIAGSIYAKLPSKTIDDISKYMTKEDFKIVINDTIEKSKSDISILLDTIIDSASNNHESLQKATSFRDLINLLFTPSENEKIIAQALERIIVNAISHPNIFSLLKGLWSENIKPYGVNSDDVANTKFAKDLFNELPKLIKEIGLIEKVIKSISQSAKNNDSTQLLIENIGKDIINGLHLTDYKLAQIILKSDTLVQNKQTLKEDILTIVNKITTDDTLTEKFVVDFKLDSALTKLGVTQQSAVKTLQSAFKSQELKNILEAFLNELFNNNEKYASLESWPNALGEFFRSSNATTIRDSLKHWIREIFTNNEDVSNALGKGLAKLMRSNGFNFAEEKDHIVQDFIKSFAKQAVNTKILDDIVDSLFSKLKEIDKHELSKFPELIQNAFKEGAMKFISSDGVVMLSKIFENKDVFKSIFSNLDTKAYSDFINLLFESSPADFNKGIYAIMFAKPNESSNFNASSGISGIIKGEFGAFIEIFVSPLVDQFFKELNESQKYTDINELKKNTQAYHSIWRFYAFLSQILYTNSPGGLFWNRTGLTAEAFTMEGFIAAFKNKISKYPNLLDKYSNNLRIIGFANKTTPLSYYISGQQLLSSWLGTYNSRSGGLSSTFYGRDHTLVYIYYGNNKDSKYNNTKTFKQVLLEDMLKGYQPTETK